MFKNYVIYFNKECKIEKLFVSNIISLLFIN